MTDVGVQEYRVPATFAEREQASDALEWRASDNNAVDVILMEPRNYLATEAWAQKQGLPLVPTVLQRRMKVDPSTKRLQKRKSRLCEDGPRGQYARARQGIAVERGARAESAGDLEFKMLIGNAAAKGKRLLKADVGNAYCKARTQQQPVALKLGKAVERFDDQGRRLCIIAGAPLYGQITAGDDWDDTFSADLAASGWEPAEAVPAAHVARMGNDQAELLRVVDDVLIAVPWNDAGQALGDRTLDVLRELYGEITYEWDPTSYAGYTIDYNVQAGIIRVHMAHHVEQAVRQFLPRLASHGERPSKALKKGDTFRSLADSMALVKRQPGAPLTPQQKLVQRMVGVMRYPEKCIVAITLPMHRLSCVAASAPPQAQLVAELTLEVAWDNRHVGLTFGAAENPALNSGVHAHVDLEGGRPPQCLEAAGDATWGAGFEQLEDLPPLASLAQTDELGREVATRDLYAQVITYHGAAVHHSTKKVALLHDSSTGEELTVMALLAERLDYARTIARAYGDAQTGPTTILSDSDPGMRIVMRQGASTRARHQLRRVFILMQRIRQGEVRVLHVPDEENYTDFLTKWVPAKKLRASLDYVTGRRIKKSAN